MIGIVHIEDEVYVTNRNNEGGVAIDRVQIQPTWDIDRSGSKGQVSVTADAGVLTPGMWLSTYRTITPERGEIVRFPRGHWHLSRPGITYPGGHEMDTGNVAVMQTASGSDIVDDIAGVVLTEAFYTPVNGHVMNDVRVLAQMATAGIMGPNLVTNGSFENYGTGWTLATSAPHGGSDGYDQWGASPPASGSRYWWWVTNASAPINTDRYASQDIPIPPGTRYVYASGMAMRLSSDQQDLMVVINGVYHFSPAWQRTAYGVWGRRFLVAPVPDGVTSVTVVAYNQYKVAGPASGEVRFWDDIRLGTCTHMPLPDDRFDLPDSGAIATTRIQTSENKNTLYDAINADRLSAIGMNALATDMSGRLTTQTIRTLANATPKYTFGPNDIELLDMVPPEISAINELPPNHWRAVKEDPQDADLSMRADSYNNNANDPFSVINSGGIRSAQVITVQDAISQTALQAVADGARDRYSLAETVRFAIMPIRDINVYDIVAIADADMPEINGLWALNSIDASGDYLTITATRAVSREM